jgi:hypothetical protein
LIQILCAYCGKAKASTKDHVFPKSLYPASKTSSSVQRLTVPCCKECNNSWSNDEAHFRNILALAGEPNDSRNELWETKIQRSFKEKDAHRRIQDIKDACRLIEVDCKSKHMIFPGEDNRVIRIVKKIVRGLSHEHKILSAVPESHVWVDVMKYQIPEKFLEQMSYDHREPDIVEYRYSVIEEDGIQSAWFITFFERITFVGIVKLHPCE